MLMLICRCYYATVCLFSPLIIAIHITPAPCEDVTRVSERNGARGRTRTGMAINEYNTVNSRFMSYSRYGDQQ